MPNQNTRSSKDKEAEEGNFLDVVAKTAVDELREDEATRRQCLAQFREWIQSNSDIQNCLMGKKNLYFSFEIYKTFLWEQLDTIWR